MQQCVCNLHDSGSLNFSFHTFEISLSLRFDEYSHMSTLLFQSSCRTWREEFGSSIYIKSDIFSAQGVSVSLRYTTLSGNAAGFMRYDLFLRINPRIAIGDISYTGIYECTSFNNRTLVQFLNKIVSFLGLATEVDITSMINQFRISRLDLCVNYKFESDDLASKYLALLRRGNRTKFLAEKTCYDTTAHRAKSYKNELLLEADSFRIYVYQKAAQMQDNIQYFGQIPECAEGLLRFEMQLRPSKLRYCTKDAPVTSLIKFLPQIEALCRKEFKRYSKTLFCEGDYYTLGMAKEVVRQYHPNSSSIIRFLDAVSKNKSLFNTVKEYQQDGRSCRYCIDELNKLQINPVTIPERWLGPDGYLPSLSHLLGLSPTALSDGAPAESVC